MVGGGAECSHPNWSAGKVHLSSGFKGFGKPPHDPADTFWKCESTAKAWTPM